MQRHRNKKIQYVRLLSVLTLALMVLMSSGFYVLAADSPLTIKVTQDIKNASGATAGGTVTYQLTAESGVPLPNGAKDGVYSFDLSGDTSRDITLPISKTGVFTYTVKPVTSGSGFTYDTQSYRIRLDVKHLGTNPDVVMQIRYVGGRYDGDKAAGITYHHTTTGTGGSGGGGGTGGDGDTGDRNTCTAADPPVRKLIDGDTPKNDATFTFVMEAEDDSQPMPDGSAGGRKTVTVTGAGSAEFGDIAYTEAGVYKYTISELEEEISGYTFDTGTYTLTNTVTENGGNLNVSQSLENPDGTTTTDIQSMTFEFTNKYDADDDDSDDDDGDGDGNGKDGNGKDGNGGDGTGNGASKTKTGDIARVLLFTSVMILSLTIAVIFRRSRKEQTGR